MEKPYAGRATVIDFPTHLEIFIPARRVWFFMIFFGLWLCGWFFGGLMALAATFANDGLNTAAVVFLAGWLIISFLIMLLLGRVVWWMAFGKEMIGVGPGILTIERRGDWFYKTKSYDLNLLANLRVQENYISYNAFWGMPRRQLFEIMTGGVIRFDYGMKTVKFAGGIDEAEGTYLLKLMREKGYMPSNNNAN